MSRGNNHHHWRTIGDPFIAETPSHQILLDFHWRLQIFTGEWREWIVSH